MKTVFFLLLVSLSIGTTKAQELITITQNFQNMASHLPKSTILDTTRLVVLYQFNYPVDNLQGGFKQVDDILCFQIGRKVCKTFSQNLYLLDRNLSFEEKNNVKFRLNYTPYAIFSNYPEGFITQENKIPYAQILQGSTQVVNYSEPTPNIEWNLMEQTDTIAGYNCQLAKCSFRGRDWEVWYTPEIPSTFSIWKFSGLPGLILKAKDTTGTYSFEATEIRAENTPIELFDWKPIKKSRSEWLKLEEGMYKHPGNYFSNNGQITVFNTATMKEFSAEEWSVPYDPIEKE